MSAGAIAERYAQALFELGDEAGNLAVLSEKLGYFVNTYETSRQLRSTLRNPTLSDAQQVAILSAVAKKIGVPELGVKGLLVMARRGRLDALGATVARLSELADIKNGVVRASVITAAKMPESYYQSLTTQLQNALKKKVILERSVDTELVGGAIAQVGDMVIDGSIRGQLAKVEREIIDAVAVKAS